MGSFTSFMNFAICHNMNYDEVRHQPQPIDKSRTDVIIPAAIVSAGVAHGFANEPALTRAIDSGFGRRGTGGPKAPLTTGSIPGILPRRAELRLFFLFQRIERDLSHQCLGQIVAELDLARTAPLEQVLRAMVDEFVRELG